MYTSRLTQSQILVLICEEAAEVIQAATKCLRFGYFTENPEYGVNSLKLAQEVGDLMGCVDALRFKDIHALEMQEARETKIRRALDALNGVKNGC